MMGNQNCHVKVAFQDGVEWLACFRLTKSSSPPRQVRDFILRSEAATMMHLQQHTRIPTPKAFDWACESDPTNSLGKSAPQLVEELGTASADALFNQAYRMPNSDSTSLHNTFKDSDDR
ncbi:Uncharacterized protein TCAP_06015 [Tolypocladium capitatum]|uniref:Uncharacterized protein n=1 Tax=Tolypocladium capitatum TaxID=45235 RepID=A0A2K3Q906_9HYPO|nr:Uncharacterized protein TCAP_06015 [Tolypocladium capitatum]